MQLIVNISFTISVMLLSLLLHGEAHHFKRLYPDTEIERELVPKNMKPWKVPYPEYNPPVYTAPCTEGCDSNDPRGIFFDQYSRNSSRRTWTYTYKVDENNLPLNPKGRTGIAGRGSLPRWGPNHMGIVVITRNQWSEVLFGKSDSDETKPSLLMGVMDCRQNSAFPTSVKRKFKSELMGYFGSAESEKILTKAKKNSKLEFQGYFPDEMNTDNAWIELSIYKIDDPIDQHIGRMKFDSEDSEFEWKKYNKKIVDQTVDSLIMMADMNFEEKLQQMWRTSLWSMKKRNIDDWAASLTDLFNHGLTYAAVLNGIIGACR